MAIFRGDGRFKSLCLQGIQVENMTSPDTAHPTQLNITNLKTFTVIVPEGQITFKTLFRT